MVLHQKSNFIKNVNRQYDDRFAQSGAKIGSTLQVRLPNRYTVGTSATIVAQDTTEQKVDLVVSTRRNVPLSFTDTDLTMDIDNFSERIIEPAVAQLAASVESYCLGQAYLSVYNQINNNGSPATVQNFLNARKKLVDGLAPDDDLRAVINTQANVDMVDATKGLVNSQSELAKQYIRGRIGRGLGFEGGIFENTLLPRHTSGTDDGTTTTYRINGAGQAGASMTIDSGTGTFAQGDIITIAGVYRVHPESRNSTNVLQQFVVTTASASTATSIAISPSIVTTGALQNVTTTPADSAIITKVGGVTAAYDISLMFHKDAFIFATADLEKVNGVDMFARERMDGISMRLIRDYVPNTDERIVRLDVHFGFLVARPEIACRLATN